MNKADYDGGLRRQAMSYPDLVPVQVEGVKKGLQDIPKDNLVPISRIYVTGSGDSYAAARGVMPAIRHYVGAFGTQLYCDTPEHVGRYLNVDKRLADKTLLIAISCWGFPMRVTECERRFNQFGCLSIDVTNFPDSPVGHEAGEILMVNCPHFPDMTPGCRDYMGSWVGTMMLAAHMAEAKDSAKAGLVNALGDAILAFGESYRPLMDKMDDEMFALSQSWQHCTSFEGIGDGAQYASAFFFPAKIIEVAGGYSSWSSTEQFRHITAHAKNAGNIGTLISADINADNKSCIAEATKLAVSLGRKVLFVGNAPKEEFGITESVPEFTVPTPPAGYEFLNPMLDHLPPTILASYISAFWQEPYMRRGSGGPLGVSDADNVWAQEGASTLTTSKIVVVD